MADAMDRARMEGGDLVGLLAEFESDHAIVAAARAFRDRGYRVMDAFTPRPVELLQELIAPERSNLNRTVFIAGALGAATGLGVQWFCNAWDYPINVGGRPPFSLPAFIPITFEVMVLFASLAAFFGFMHRVRLPWLSHPIFRVLHFERASIDRFWLFISATDPVFREHEAKQLVADFGCIGVCAMPSPDTASAPPEPNP